MKKLALILLAALFAGCGTDSGNPGFAPVNGEAPGFDFISPIVCAKIRNCFSKTLSYCESGVMTAPNFTSAMGVPQYATLVSVTVAVENGELTKSSSAIESCHVAIGALSCSDPLVTQSYSVAAPDDYSQVFNLLSSSPSCSSMVH